MSDDDMSQEKVEKMKLVAVVDSIKTFSNNDCIYLEQKKHRISHLSVNQLTSMQFDEFVSSYDQVFKIGRALAQGFI
jgi:hypothetical protein